MSRRSIVIGLDGATFTILDPLMEEGVMPFLKQVTSSGVRSTLRSVVPPITPPAWASLMTGRSPGNHGIFDFFVQESPTSHYLRPVNSRHVQCETLWSMVSRQGLTATVLNFPLMAPPRPIAGYSVAGWMPWRQMRGACYPSSLYDELKTIPGFNVKDLALDLDIELKAVDDCEPEEREEWVEFHIRREQQWFAILKHLMQKHPCDLTAILFEGVDKIQHLFWRFIDPACLPANLSPEESRVRNLCLSYFREIDSIIADLFSIAGSDTNIFIVSDHGAGPSIEVFYLNSWLHENGYLHWQDEVQDSRNGTGLFGLDTFLRQPHQIDWTRTTAYAVTPSSNGIYMCTPGEKGGNGVSLREYKRLRNELIDALTRYVDPISQERVVTRVLVREEAFSGSLGYLAPDLTLELRDGGFVSLLRSPAILEPRPMPVGVHRPDGILVASGPDIGKGVRLPLSYGEGHRSLQILDVAPTLLYASGLDIPSDLEGVPCTKIFEPSFVQTQPVRIGVPTQTPNLSSRASDKDMDAEGEATVLARLKALGYID